MSYPVRPQKGGSTRSQGQLPKGRVLTQAEKCRDWLAAAEVETGGGVAGGGGSGSGGDGGSTGCGKNDRVRSGLRKGQTGVLRYQRFPYATGATVSTIIPSSHDMEFSFNSDAQKVEESGIPSFQNFTTYPKLNKSGHVSIPSRHYPQHFMVQNGVNAGPPVYDYPSTRLANAMEAGDDGVEGPIATDQTQITKPTSATLGDYSTGPVVLSGRHSAGDRRGGGKGIDRQNSFGSSSSSHSFPGWEDPQDLEHLHDSMTLPRIEAVLRSEGIEQDSISQQISKIKERCRRVEARKPPHVRHKSQPVPKLKLPSRSSTDGDVINSRNDVTPRNRKKAVPTVRELMSTRSTTPREEALETVQQKARQELDAYLCDIADTRWLSSQQMERSIMGNDCTPPRLLVVSSNVTGSDALLSTVLPSDSVLSICYNFESSTYSSLLETIREKLNSHKEGCKMKSLLLYCQGGPGHMYMFKRKVVTAQKLQKKENQDIISFWKDLGDLFSKLQPEESYLHILGSDLLGRKQGDQLLKELDTLFKPNKVTIGVPSEDTDTGRETLKLYFDCDKYMQWRARVSGKPGSPSSSSSSR